MTFSANIHTFGHLGVYKNAMMETSHDKGQSAFLAEIVVGDDGLSFSSPIEQALAEAEIELTDLKETIETIATLRPKCDKMDYALAASSGAICGLIDIFLVGTPLHSPLGKITDKWFENRVVSFAKGCRWINAKKKSIWAKAPRPPKDIVSAIRWLQLTFKIPYDQTSWGDAANYAFDIKLNTDNHHFLSLGHNPSICGLFFSILDQFTNSSHFVAGKEFIELVDAGKGVRLQGKSFVGKVFCGFCNWFGHIMSDISGSDGSTKRGNRGMGIPSPLWTWMNDVIVIKSKLGIKPSDFDAKFNQLALDIYNDGYDFRFQTTQAIPVIINGLVVRLIYAVRRLLQYYQETDEGSRSINDALVKCRPANNPEISRMLTVAHGTFCLLDATDATVRGFITGAGGFNPKEFILRLNIIGLGRFAVSLGSEVQRYWKAKSESLFAKRKKPILEDYIEGLKVLAQYYDDKELYSLAERVCDDKHYKDVFSDTVTVATRRGVKAYPTKESVDDYFNKKK